MSSSAHLSDATVAQTPSARSGISSVLMSFTGLVSLATALLYCGVLGFVVFSAIHGLGDGDPAGTIFFGR